MYEDYKIFGPYSRKDKRQIVILEDANRNKITVSYPKFIVENFLGRKLDPNLETIDHIDGNFLNDLKITTAGTTESHASGRVKITDFSKIKSVNSNEGRIPRL